MRTEKFIRVGVLCLLCTGFTPALQAEQGDWLVRARGIVIHPDDSSGRVSGIAGSGVDVDSSVVPELDVTYMFHKHWGIEVIAGIAEHTVSAEGSGLAFAGVPNGFDLFDSWVLPPTVTLQYHFLPDNNIRPYVGFGVNYTAFLENDATDAFEAVAGPTDVDLDNSWGWAAQAGVDITVKDNWFVNLDVKYIDINTTATLQTTGLGRLRVNVDVDPFVFGAGIGYRF